MRSFLGLVGAEVSACFASVYCLGFVIGVALVVAGGGGGGCSGGAAGGEVGAGGQVGG